MTEKVLFFFSAVGVFNAFLLAVYLIFFKSSSSQVNLFTGILILLLAVRVGVSCYHFFETVPPIVIKLGLLSNLLVGPALLVQMKSRIQPSGNLVHQSLYHFGFWLIVLLPQWFLLDFYTWDWKVRFVIHAVLTSYLLYILLRWRIQSLAFLRNENQSNTIRKAILIFFAVVVVCTGFAVSLFTNYILGPLIFTVVFYLLTIYLVIVDKGIEKHSASSRKITSSEFQRLNQRLEKLMEEEKLYRNPELSLEMLARRLTIGRHLLSQLLNDNLDKSFYQYINDYRIQEACQMLRRDKQFSIEAIGYEVGFNSRSSFFSSFKKLKGQTPSKYREEA